MCHRSVLFLFTANIFLSAYELKTDRVDFCCSNTCCCSLCTAEQCQLPDQPGKQCRCYNTTNIICSRFRNFISKPEPRIGSTNQDLQILHILPGQPALLQVLPMSIDELYVNPFCCAFGNCPVWVKCRHPPVLKRDQSALQSMPLPLIVFISILLAVTIIVTIGLCVAASFYINNSQKRRNCNIYNGTD